MNFRKYIFFQTIYKVKDNNNYNIVGVFAIKATAQFHSQSELTCWAVSNPTNNLS